MIYNVRIIHITALLYTIYKKHNNFCFNHNLFFILLATFVYIQFNFVLQTFRSTVKFSSKIIHKEGHHHQYSILLARVQHSPQFTSTHLCFSPSFPVPYIESLQIGLNTVNPSSSRPFTKTLASRLTTHNSFLLSILSTQPSYQTMSFIFGFWDRLFMMVIMFGSWNSLFYSKFIFERPHARFLYYNKKTLKLKRKN